MALDVEAFLKSALGNSNGAAIPVGQQFLNGDGTPTNLSAAFAAIESSFRELNDKFKVPGGLGGPVAIYQIVLDSLKQFCAADEFKGALNKRLLEFLQYLVQTAMQSADASMSPGPTLHASAALVGGGNSLSPEISSPSVDVPGFPGSDSGGPSLPIPGFPGSDSGGSSGLGDLLGLIIKLLVELSAEIVKMVTKPLSDVSAELFKALGDLIKTVLKNLTSALSNLDNLPAPLRHGPFEALSALSSLRNLLTDVQTSSGTYLSGIIGRGDAVANSLKSLIDVLSSRMGDGAGVKDTGLTLIKNSIDHSTDLIKNLLEGKKPEEALRTFMLAVFVDDPIDAIVGVFKSAGDTKLWSCFDLPSMMPVGMLNAWLNEAAYYNNPSSKALERQFRARMISVIDAYVRHELDQVENGYSQRTAPNLAFGRDVDRSTGDMGFTQRMSLNHSDQRDSGQALADAVCLLVDSIVHFIFEPECFPLSEIDLHGIEDLGIRFAMLLARQIRVTIRGIIGMVFRGIWAWSFMNTVLIEFVAVIISALFSAIIEAVIRNLTWTLRVASCYGSALFEDPRALTLKLKNPLTLGGAQLVYYWPSAETVENSNLDADRLWYLATVRNPDAIRLPDSYPIAYKGKSDDFYTADTTAPTDGIDFRYILGLLRDFGAYIDVTYQRFRVDSRFPVTEADDEVTITRAEISGKRFSVWATTSSTFESPQPVLRAYFCCQVVPMRPGPFPGDPYTAEFDVELAPRCADVIVLSNQGGVAKRRAVRI